MDGHVGDQCFQERPLSDGKFSIGFRVLSSEYFDYAELIEKETGISNCPQECQQSRKRFDKTRTQLCDECPRKRHLKEFREATEERWDQWELKIDFDEMLSTFFKVKSLDGQPDDALSLKTSMLVSIVETERSKAHARQARSVRASQK
jgi:hypothetical protein